MTEALVVRLPMPLPALVISAGERAGVRLLEFFDSNIRNTNTRRAYAYTVGDFLAWCAQAWRDVDRGRSASTRGGLDRVTNAHVIGANGCAAPDRHPSLVRLARDWRGRAA